MFLSPSPGGHIGLHDSISYCCVSILFSTCCLLSAVITRSISIYSLSTSSRTPHWLCEASPVLLQRFSSPYFLLLTLILFCIYHLPFLGIAQTHLCFIFSCFSSDSLFNHLQFTLFNDFNDSRVKSTVMDDGEETQWSCYRITLKPIKGHIKVNKWVYWLIVGNINWPPLNMIGLKPAQLPRNNPTSDCAVMLNEHHCWHLSSFNEDTCKLSSGGPITVRRASPVRDSVAPTCVDVAMDDGQQLLELEHGNL